MGTASLVIGLIFIIFGFGLFALFLEDSSATQEEFQNQLLGSFIIVIPLIVVGSIFLRKYDKDKRRFAKNTESSLDILKERYAKGEITKEEFEKMKKDLEN